MEPEVLPHILCPVCGAPTQSFNDSNMCANCLRQQVDITDGITKQVTLFWCRGCGRYNKGTSFVPAQLESPELMAICLKKIKGLGKSNRLVDVKFIWTEPHSRRIKLKATVQKEVFNTVMQQSFVVEFIVTNQQCPDCQASYTEHTWSAVVQIRQKVKHKRTFLWLEQLMLKHNVTARCMGIKEHPDGLDFFWGSKANANSLVAWLQSVVPLRIKTGKRLISADLSSNTQKFKHSIMAEIAPICKHDLVLLPKKVSGQMGGFGPLVLCLKVTANLTFIDPRTLQIMDMNSTQYWRTGFGSLLSSRRCVEYVVLDIEYQSPNSHNPHNNQNKYTLAEATVARSSDFGVNDNMFTVSTHLGHLLKPGDYALGFDMVRTNLNDEAVKDIQGRELPDVILVKKTYPNRKNRARKRVFKLKHLDKTKADKIPKKHEQKREEEDYELFMQDIEEDAELQSAINMYKRLSTGDPASSPAASADASASSSAAAQPPAPVQAAATEDDDFPQIDLANLLDDMTIDAASQGQASVSNPFAALDPPQSSST